MRKHLWVARKAPTQLKTGYKKSSRRVVEGVAKTGEVSPKGLVAHTEHWDGRVAAEAGPSTLRYVIEKNGRIRPMTFKEMVDKGYFIIGRGPSGVRVRRQHER